MTRFRKSLSFSFTIKKRQNSLRLDETKPATCKEFSTQASTSFCCVLTERNAGKATSFPGFSPTCHIPLRGRVEDSLGTRERRKRYKVRHTCTTKKEQKQIKNKKKIQTTNASKNRKLKADSGRYIKWQPSTLEISKISKKHK